MNEKVYAAAARLTDEQRKQDRKAFFKSIHATLNHLLVADQIWMGRFNAMELREDWIGPGGIRALDQELHVDFDQQREARVTLDFDIERWTGALTKEGLEGSLRFTRRGGQTELPLWSAVAHFFNHQTHHRGQVTTLLTQAGHDVGVTDLVAMLREEGQRKS